MNWHIDPTSGQPKQCLSTTCSKDKSLPHYASYKEALSCSELAREINNKSPQSAKQLAFDMRMSTITGYKFLESNFFTTLQESVIVTIEENENYCLGSLFIRGSEYGLNRTLKIDSTSLEECANKSLQELELKFSQELWPSNETLALYEKITRESNESLIKASSALELQRSLKSNPISDFYVGELSNGDEIRISAIHKYAVAEIRKENSTHIVYEAGLSEQIFANENERNSFAAKAFSHL